MADYYPLIARAIAGLDPNAPGESRRALYERARAALISQLRSVQPPLSESEITRERLSLEEAVRKVESEAAQRARDARSGNSSGGGASRAGDAFRRATNPRSADTAGAPGGQPGAPRPQPSAPPAPPPSRSDRPPLGQDPDPERPIRSPRADGPVPPRPQGPPPQPQVSMQEPQLPPVRDRAGAAPPPRRGDNGSQAPGVRGFRDIAADADDLGRAAAQANRAARKTYANVPSPSPEFDRIEPDLEGRGADGDAPYSWDDSIDEAERYSPPPPVPRTRIGSDREREPKRARAGAVFPFKSAIAIGIVLILVGAAILWGKTVISTVNGLFKSAPVIEQPKDASNPLNKPKIPDRVGQPSSTTEEPVAPVAQRVVLYDEDPSDPKGKQYVGSVVWRTEPIKASGNEKADIAVRADIRS